MKDGLRAPATGARAEAIMEEPAAKGPRLHRGNEGDADWILAAPAEGARRAGVPFEADLDLSELDERTRPGPTWQGRSRELSRSHVVFVSRRMCYPGRRMVLAVHLVDAYPVPLFGQATACEYDGMGQYRTSLDLLSMPVSEAVRAWLRQRQVRGTL